MGTLSRLRRWWNKPDPEMAVMEYRWRIKMPEGLAGNHHRLYVWDGEQLWVYTGRRRWGKRGGRGETT